MDVVNSDDGEIKNRWDQQLSQSFPKSINELPSVLANQEGLQALLRCVFFS